jgi:hypothetical protein
VAEIRTGHLSNTSQERYCLSQLVQLMIHTQSVHGARQLRYKLLQIKTSRRAAPSCHSYIRQMQGCLPFHRAA